MGTNVVIKKHIKKKTGDKGYKVQVLVSSVKRAKEKRVHRGMGGHPV